MNNINEENVCSGIFLSLHILNKFEKCIEAETRKLIKILSIMQM